MTEAAEVVRAFLALPLSTATSAAAGALRRSLEGPGPKVSWARPADMHLTLRFFGDLSRGRAEALTTVAARAVAAQPAFSFRLGGLGAFPALERPRVLWLGVEEGREELALLFAALDEALLEAGVPREDRPFHPHVTLGRVRGPPPARALRRRVASCPLPSFVPDEARRVVLFESAPDEGRRYRPLAELPLAAAPPGVL